jgi:hypothetical protein
VLQNGASTAVKKAESANLRNEHLMPDIQLFMGYIQGHRKEPDAGYEPIIEKEICRSAKFAAFKRKIIRDDPELYSEFSKALA